MRASPARACCSKSCTSAAWRCPRLAPACTRAMACCSRGTPSRSRRGRPKLARGNAPQPAAERLCAHDLQRVRQRRKSSSSIMAAWDACVQPTLTPSSERLPIWCRGRRLDQARQHGAVSPSPSTRRANVFASCSTACSPRRRVIPSTSRPRWRPRCSIGASVTSCAKFCSIRFKWRRVSQRLAKAHVPIEEFPQTVPNLTAATQQPVRSDPVPPAGALPRRRHAAWRSAAPSSLESSRGWRLDKLKQAAQDRRAGRAVRWRAWPPCAGKGSPVTICFAPGLFDDDADDKQASDERYRRELGAHIYACTGIWPR